MPSRHRVSASPAANAPLPSPSFSFPPPISLYDLSLSLVEAVFSLGEFIVAMAVIKETLMKLYHALHHTDTIPPYNLFAMHVAINASVMALVAWRLASRLGVPVHALVDKLGLGLTELLSSKAWGKLTVAVIVLHTLGFAGMALSHYWFGERLFSLTNYYRASGDFDLNMVSDMLFLAPLREELVFRAVIFCVFYIRLGDDTPSTKLLCALLTGVVFGLVHLMNLMGNKYLPLYIALQVGLGVLLGAFYSLRFALSGTLWQSVIMHAVNNFYSSFVPLDIQLDLTNPLIGIPLLQTLVVYATLTAISVRELYAQGVQQFKPLTRDDVGVQPVYSGQPELLTGSDTAESNGSHDADAAQDGLVRRTGRKKKR